MTPESPPAKSPVVLCILDGWGLREGGDDNAIHLARTPNWDRLTAACPPAALDASAEAVGLPAGQMGNSEVGHMNIGAGRVLLQDLPRIDAQIAGPGLGALAPMRAFLQSLKSSGGACHIMGLLSPGGVHAHQDHIAALAKTAAGAGLAVRIHAFLDGRDTPPASAAESIAAFENQIAGLADTRIATVTGRYYAMDRDQRWDRVVKAYGVLVEGEGAREGARAENAAESAETAVRASYAAGVTDEFVEPVALGDYTGMADGDGFIMANFRADRAREILSALADPAFDGFGRPRVPRFAAMLGMAAYSDHLSTMIPALFPSETPRNVLGAVAAAAGRRQLRAAETEKYAHVTFFLNGGREDPFEGEDRILVPSPKVATYDLQPEMSAAELTDQLVQAIEGGGYDLAVVNYANGDMVGHTGMLEAAVKAAETIDACLGRLEAAVTAAGGVMLITADHGNCEQMRAHQGGGAHTAHTVNPVPLVLTGAPAGVAGVLPGKLSDLAPTVLALMGLEQPAEMTGRVLLRASGAAAGAE
ncbi:MAG: 2,3-bisphosphoglycerate-independent phosphoglycerate mutase [Rhodospirillales bacterium]